MAGERILSQQSGAILLDSGGRRTLHDPTAAPCCEGEPECVIVGPQCGQCVLQDGTNAPTTPCLILTVTLWDVCQACALEYFTVTPNLRVTMTNGVIGVYVMPRMWWVDGPTNPWPQAPLDVRNGCQWYSPYIPNAMQVDDYSALGENCGGEIVRTRRYGIRFIIDLSFNSTTIYTLFYHEYLMQSQGIGNPVEITFPPQRWPTDLGDSPYQYSLWSTEILSVNHDPPLPDLPPGECRRGLVPIESLPKSPYDAHCCVAYSGDACSEPASLPHRLETVVEFIEAAA